MLKYLTRGLHFPVFLDFTLHSVTHIQVKRSYVVLINKSLGLLKPMALDLHFCVHWVWCGLNPCSLSHSLAKDLGKFTSSLLTA